jgi:hypothetical protein
VAKKFKGSSIKRGNYVEFVGGADLLKKIEAAGGKVDQAVKKCVDNSLEQVGMKMQLFMLGHKETGDTFASYEQIKASIKGNTVEAMVGYSAKNGGLPAIFLDVGTPKQKPFFFRYYAVENSSKQIKDIQQATLNEILEGLR